MGQEIANHIANEYERLQGLVNSTDGQVIILINQLIN